MITAIKNFLLKKTSTPVEKPAAAAYDDWSGSYDAQPDNLMLDLDAQLFDGFIKKMDLKNKRVADIGCGTGRHWHKLYALKPYLLMGFDVSEGMLCRLKQKFPLALAEKITDNHLNKVPDSFADCIISTLTIAHIKNIEQAIAAWSRIIKAGGDLYITDFHPAILAKGGKRSFRYNGNTLAVVNYVHPLKKLKEIFHKYRFNIIEQEERYVDEKVRPCYELQNALPVYERFKDMPLIYALHLKKDYAAE